jgi:hypothetical protein
VYAEHSQYLPNYQVMSAMFCLNSVREEALGHPYTMSADDFGADYDPAAAAAAAAAAAGTAPRKIPRNMDSYDFANGRLMNFGTEPRAPVSKTVHVGLEGVPFFSRPKNWTSISSNRMNETNKNEMPVIPANTTLTFKLNRPSNTAERLINSTYPMKDYLETAACPPKYRHPAGAEIRLESASIVGEQIEFVGYNFPGVTRGKKVDLFMDLPQFHESSIPDRLRSVSCTFTLPVHTHLVYLGFLKSYQLMRDDVEFKNPAPVFKFPSNLTRLTFRYVLDYL